jgi:hypothetical protein
MFKVIIFCFSAVLFCVSKIDSVPNVGIFYRQTPKHVAQDATHKTAHNTDDLLRRNTTITGTHSRVLTNRHFLLILTNQI